MEEVEMHRLLIIDDEPNLVEGLYDYLTTILSPDIEIWKAYSGQEACQLMSQFFVDLLISDIQMPGMTGLELLEQVEKNNPRCRVIFLTGYNTFSWVQKALRHSCCVDYILKTQGDQVISESVLNQLQKIEEETKEEELIRQAAEQVKALQPFMNQKKLTDWLVKGKPAPTVTENGIQTAKKLLLVLFHCKTEHRSSDMYQLLIQKLVKDEFRNVISEIVFMGWGDYVMLLQCEEAECGNSVYHYLHMRLERMQALMRNAGYVTNAAFLDNWVSAQSAGANIKKMHDQLLLIENTDQEVIIRCGDKAEESRKNSDEIMVWIKKYVMDHISDINLSLGIIAEKTCYAPAYLSRLFKQKEGVNFLEYVSQMRIYTACNLLTEGKKNINQISRMVGFESPSYFSAFFKRRTGKTPQQYMREMKGQ